MKKQLNLKPTFNEDEDEDNILQNRLGFSYEQQVQTNVSVHINEPFMEPSYYNSVVDALERATQGDVFTFKLNSSGGRYDGLVSLLDAIEKTEAFVIAEIVGECASAASIFALSCHSVIVGKYADMLCHACRYGFSGKDGDNVSKVLHTSKISSKLLYEAYEGFLSNEEIAEVISGKELYLDSEQIMERLEKREEYFEAKALAEEDNLEEQTKDLVFPPLEYNPDEVKFNPKKKSKGK